MRFIHSFLRFIHSCASLVAATQVRISFTVALKQFHIGKHPTRLIGNETPSLA